MKRLAPSVQKMLVTFGKEVSSRRPGQISAHHSDFYLSGPYAFSGKVGNPGAVSDFFARYEKLTQVRGAESFNLQAKFWTLTRRAVRASSLALWKNQRLKHVGAGLVI